MMSKKIGGILLGLAVCLGGTAYAVAQGTTQKEQPQQRQQEMQPQDILQQQQVGVQQQEQQARFQQQELGQQELGQQEFGQQEFGQPQLGQQEFGQPQLGQPQLGFAQQGRQDTQDYQTQAAIVAPVPQYWIADAALFTSIANDTAQTLRAEGLLYIQETRILASQSQFLVNAISRSLSSVRALEANVQSANPSALPAIRAATGNLMAARAEAGVLAAAASAGILGPSFDINAQTVSQHLSAAERQLRTVAGQYGVQGLVTPGGTQGRAGR